jgi:transglutaminase-like putative cysteine protease
MRISILHETAYRYDSPIRGLIQHLRLTPRDHEGQHVLRWRIEPSVDGRLKPREDAFGNIVQSLSAEGPIESFTVRVTGLVETSDAHGVVGGAVERLPDLFYLRETPLTEADAEIRAFVLDTVGPEPKDRLEGLHRLLVGLHREVIFDTQPTHAATTAAEAFALRRGVCQDLTHIFIGGVRALGIPARYVSGYFHRADGVQEQDAGHAWVEAKVPDLGWVGFDPTNGISTGEAHVRVAIGLDYLGAAPVRGSRYGGGPESLDVRLSIDAAQAQMQA